MLMEIGLIKSQGDNQAVGRRVYLTLMFDRDATRGPP